MLSSSSLRGVAALALVLLSLVPSLCAQSLSFTTLTLSAPWPGRQQGGLFILGSSPSITSSLPLLNGSTVGVPPSSTFVWGGQNCSSIASCVPNNDVWYSQAPALPAVSRKVATAATATYASQGYGPATCADLTTGTLYSLGGDTSAQTDQAGTNTVYYSYAPLTKHTHPARIAPYPSPHSLPPCHVLCPQHQLRRLLGFDDRSLARSH